MTNILKALLCLNFTLIAIAPLNKAFAGPKALRRHCQALEVSGQSAGVASWYGDELHGGPTASGEVFNQYDLTAAHRTLPFDSLVKVTLNDRSVVVRINDSGPYYGNRIIDLSKEAARKLDMLDRGIAHVQLELLECGR